MYYGFLPLIIVLAFYLTKVFRHYALLSNVVDIPNARSSHSAPTPRGGGMAIVLSFLLILPLLGVLDLVSWPVIFALFGSGGGIAILGYWDDREHLTAHWRLVGHFSGAIWALYWLGGLPILNIFGLAFEPGWFGDALAVLYLVWLLNLYNFMDGIDGIASVECLCVCGGGALLYGLMGEYQLILLPLVLAAAVTGFLFWNYPPARIFMGDSGSGFLGIVLGVLSLQAAWVNPHYLWGWVILLGAFVVDATYTLLRRLLHGDRVFEAHRSHAYQYAARKYGNHRSVTLAVCIINLFWLLPIALLVGIGKLNGLLGILGAYLPLLVLAAKFKAGKPEKSGFL